MDILPWLIAGFIIIGFVVLFSMKKGMERKVALIIESEENGESNQISTKPIIWWIVGATVWGVVSMFLVVWSFSIFM